jgi:hypothetical protein
MSDASFGKEKGWGDMIIKAAFDSIWLENQGYGVEGSCQAGHHPPAICSHLTITEHYTPAPTVLLVSTVRVYLCREDYDYLGSQGPPLPKMESSNILYAEWWHGNMGEWWHCNQSE